MAYMTEGQRAAVWAGAMSDRDFGTMPITKIDLREAVDALDAFLEDNRAAINNAIPLTARDALSLNQKIRLLKFVLDLRLNDGADA